MSSVEAVLTGAGLHESSRLIMKSELGSIHFCKSLFIHTDAEDGKDFKHVCHMVIACAERRNHHNNAHKY